MVIWYEEIYRGRFPFNQHFRKFGNSGKWCRNFPEKFPDIPETDEFQKCETFNQNSRNSGIKVVWKENFQEKTFENLGIPRKVVLFLGNFWKCCSTHYRKLPKIQTGRFGWTESALFHTCPILSTRFQWTKPGARRSLVEKWNRKYNSVHLSYRKFQSWNRKCKQYFEEGWKVVRWSPSDPLETHRFRWNLRKSSRAMSQNKHTARVT